MGIHSQINTPEYSIVVLLLGILQQNIMKILVSISGLKKSVWTWDLCSFQFQWCCIFQLLK